MTTVPVVMTSLRDVTQYPQPSNPTNPTNQQPTAEAGTNWTYLPRGGLNWLGSGVSTLGTRSEVLAKHAVIIQKSIVNYNYDGGSDAELYFVGCLISDNGQVLAGSRKFDLQFNLRTVKQECAWIDNDGDATFSFWDWQTESDGVSNFWRDKKYFFNAWERDWGSYCKPLGVAKHAGTQFNMEGARKFTDEWYMYRPDRELFIQDAVPMEFMFNNPGDPRFPIPDADPLETGSPAPGCETFGVKAQFKFARGVKVN
jgi:hypothetical protein